MMTNSKKEKEKKKKSKYGEALCENKKPLNRGAQMQDVHPTKLSF